MNSVDTKIIREDIEKEIPILVENIKQDVPALKEVRVFGSYLTNKWNPEKSDVDIFVEIDDENYSVRKDTQKLPEYREIESKQREGIRLKIKENIPKRYRDLFNLHLLSSGDVRVYWNYEEEGRGPMGKTMKKGRLLYKKQSKLRSLINKF